MGAVGWSLRVFNASNDLRAPTEASSFHRDDAEALIHRFGVPNNDRVIDPQPADRLIGTRVMTFAKRQLQVHFARRVPRESAAPMWKLVGFTAPDGNAVLSGEEALRRLVVRQAGDGVDGRAPSAHQSAGQTGGQMRFQRSLDKFSVRQA